MEEEGGCLQAQGIDNNNGGVSGGRRARGISNNDKGVDGRQGIDVAFEGSEMTTEVAGAQR